MLKNYFCLLKEILLRQDYGIQGMDSRVQLQKH